MHFSLPFLLILFVWEVCEMWKIQRGYDSVTRTFRLPEELVSELETLATQNKLSLNQLVIQCLRYSVEHLDKSDS